MRLLKALPRRIAVLQWPDAAQAPVTKDRDRYKTKYNRRMMSFQTAALRNRGVASVGNMCLGLLRFKMTLTLREQGVDVAALWHRLC